MCEFERPGGAARGTPLVVGRSARVERSVAREKGLGAGKFCFALELPTGASTAETPPPPPGGASSSAARRSSKKQADTWSGPDDDDEEEEEEDDDDVAPNNGSAMDAGAASRRERHLFFADSEEMHQRWVEALERAIAAA